MNGFYNGFILAAGTFPLPMIGWIASMPKELYFCPKRSTVGNFDNYIDTHFSEIFLGCTIITTKML